MAIVTAIHERSKRSGRLARTNANAVLRTGTKGCVMAYIRTTAAVILFSMAALTACSSSSGAGSRPPENTTVVVPPNSTVTTSP